MSDNSFTLEVTGENGRDFLTSVLNIIKLNDDVSRIRVEIESNSPLITQNGQKATTQVVAPISKQKEEPEPEVEEEPVPDPIDVPKIEGVRADKVPNVKRDTQAFHVIRALSERGEPMHTPEIREIVRQEYDMAKDFSISKALWSLGDRGLVDKHESERDGRMKKYTLTSKGKAAFVKATES